MTLSLFVTGIGLTTNARIQQFAVNANVYTVYKSGFLSFYVFKITFGKSYVFKITLSFYVFKITLSFYVFKITLSFYVFKITFGKSYVVTKTKNKTKFKKSHNSTPLIIIINKNSKNFSSYSRQFYLLHRRAFYQAAPTLYIKSILCKIFMNKLLTSKNIVNPLIQVL